MKKCVLWFVMGVLVVVGPFDYYSAMNYNGVYRRNDTGGIVRRQNFFTVGDYKTINAMY